MNLSSIFCPTSIALIGASRDENSVGYSLFKNLLSPSYKGTVFAVNPKADELLGERVYHSITELPQTPDLAILAIPAAYVKQSIEELAKKGVHSAIVISAGFKEAGDDGKKLEDELVSLCEKEHITLIGPNCLGILNPHIGLNASFETVLPKEGSIAFVSQSGALISSLLDIANSRGIGFSKIVSVGNKAQITEHELLPYLFSDEQTKVIMLYAEVLSDASELIQLLRKNQQSDAPKPVVLLKAGISTAGQKASSSHTGSLAGSDAAYQALVDQAGIIRVKTVNELLSTAHLLASSPLPKGNNLAIVTNAGGPGIIATDEAERTGLALASFNEETKSILREALPRASHVGNPIDVLGDAKSDRYEKALNAAGSDPNVDSIVTIVTPQSMTDIPQTAAVVVHARNRYNKPILASFMGEPIVGEGVDILTISGVPHMQFPEDAILSLSHATEYAHTLKKHYSEPIHFDPLPPELYSVIEDLQNNHVSLINTETVFSILSQSQIPMVRSAIVQSAEDAKNVAETMKGSVVLKIVSPDISHKTDVGGVLLNVKPEDIEHAFETVLKNVTTHAPQAKTHGVLVSEMIEGDGLELIVGMKREKGLGTLIMVGMGGIYVEILKDAVFRFAPLTREDANEMIDELKAKALLYGFRGSPKRDIGVLVDVLLRISNLVTSVPQILELDINPFFLKTEGQGGVALDARMILETTS